MAAFATAVAQVGAVRSSLPSAPGPRRGDRCSSGLRDGRTTVRKSTFVARAAQSQLQSVQDVQDVRQQVALALTRDMPASIISKDAVAQLQAAVAEARAFFEKADDGLQPQLWREADVVLVGPSRTGKTTLASYLAKLGLRVANYPLVPGEDPPGHLFNVDARKVALLTTDAKQLQSIRQQRMLRMGRSSSRYAAMSVIQDELDWVRMFYTKTFPGFPVVNTARLGIAEAAAMILSHLYGRQVDEMLQLRRWQEKTPKPKNSSLRSGGSTGKLETCRWLFSSSALGAVSLEEKLALAKARRDGQRA
eukprot:s9118_g2.t1